MKKIVISILILIMICVILFILFINLQKPTLEEIEKLLDLGSRKQNVYYEEKYAL